MKYLVISVVLLSLFVLVGCGAQEAEAPEPVAEPVEAPEPTAVPAEEEAPAAEVEEATAESETAVSAGSIRILGKEGFDPLEMTISAGESVTFINEDTQMRQVTLNIFKPSRLSHATSPNMVEGDTFEVEFPEAGEYSFFVLQYGPVGAKIMVE